METQKLITTTTVRLEVELLEALRAQARREDRSLNAHVVRLLRLAVELDQSDA